MTSSSTEEASGIANRADRLDAIVTVAIPARDEEGSLARCLASVLAQQESRLQVIVVDGGSHDATAAIAEAIAAEDPRVELIRHGTAGIPGSMNAALRAAKGRWFVRVDAHSTVPPDYVGRAVEHLATGRWGGVGGRKDAVGETPVALGIAVALGSRFAVGNSTYHHGTTRRPVDHVPFGAYPTSLLRRLGGWDERLTANEDFELDHRLRLAGHGLLFDPSIRIAWRCRRSIPDLFRQYVRYGRGKADVAILHPASLRPRHLAPPALIGMLSLAAVASLTAPPLAVAIVAPYGAAIAVASAMNAHRARGGIAKASLPAAFVAMHVGWGLGFIRGLSAAVVGNGPGSRATAPVPTVDPDGSPTTRSEAGRTHAPPRSATTMRRIA